MGIIKEQSTAIFKGNTLTCQGTNINQIWDIISDALLLLPFYIKGAGWVSLGVYIQAKIIYDRHKEEMFTCSSINLRGHSLGAGIVSIVGVLLKANKYQGELILNCRGGVKALSKKLSIVYQCNDNVAIWFTNHRDIVPVLGWWYAPKNYTEITGDKKRHWLDFTPEAHLDYWG